LQEEEVAKFAGICLDTSHLENARRLFPDKYIQTINILGKFSIGANHINGVTAKPEHNDAHNYERICYDNHFPKSTSELNYLRAYPKNYFGDYIALEMENDIPSQLEMKTYLEKLLGL